jgi:hypothetical protein
VDRFDDANRLDRPRYNRGDVAKPSRRAELIPLFACTKERDGMKMRTTGLAVLTLLLALPATIRASEPVTAKNRDPQRLPMLSVYQDDQFSRGKVLTMVAATFPNVPDFTCDSWCYESPVDFLDARAIEDGKVELRHRDRHQPQAIVVTTVTPEPGAVEFLARLERDKGATAPLPADPQPLRAWRLKVYAVENDPDALMARVLRDFPNARGPR